MAGTRRRFMLMVGGGAIVAAGGSAAAFGLTREPKRALAPWTAAGGYAEPRRRALSYAILAPNPHNRQPWLADLSRPGEVAIWRDMSRRLPQTDPFDRQLTVGMGCFLELMTIAASHTGHSVSLDQFPRGEAGPVAIARFHAGGAEPDPLFAHVLERRSCKEPFEDRPVRPDPRLSALADVHTDQAIVSRLRELTWGAWEAETSTYRTMKESVDLMRMGRAEIEASPDGIDLGGPFLEGMMLAGLLTREGQLDPSSREFSQARAMYREMLSATPAYAVVRTAGNTRQDQIAAGRRWLRLNLTTTALGLSLHPVSQALQEFPEVATYRTQTHGLLARPGETVQMLGRLGYGPKTPRSPRWQLDAKLLNG